MHLKIIYVQVLRSISNCSFSNMVPMHGTIFTETEEDKIVCTCSFDSYTYPNNLLFLNIQSLSLQFISNNTTIRDF